MDDHALWVASVMISQQTEVEDIPPNRSPPIGVAQQSALYSSAFTVLPLGFQQQDAALAAQHLAKTLAENSPFVQIRAINMSFGLEFDDSSELLDGNSTLTAFVDWSAFEHDVLYVVSGNELKAIPVPIPTDNYNGITVGWSQKAGDGVFRRVVDPRPELDPEGNRTATDIIAPGFLIDVAGANGTQPPLGAGGSSGTSFAAPHVTGTVALLQQQAVGLSSFARRHEVMKAVIMNSADKIEGIIGMERTVLKSGGMDDWFDSSAHSNPTIPLDSEIGVGHLNASRAVQQLNGGRSGPGSVPLVAWDYREFTDPFQPTKYILPPLAAGDFVSATLVWDRLVFLNTANPDNAFEPGDTFTDFGFDNFDLYLVPAGATSTLQAVASSTSTEWNLEHIFAGVETAGVYEIWIELNDPGLQPFPFYALAWWAGADTRDETAGDFNGDGSVNGADYVVWRKTDGNSMTYDEWLTNFGSTSGAGGSVPEAHGIVYAVGFLVSSLCIARRRSVFSARSGNCRPGGSGSLRVPAGAANPYQV